MLFDDGIYSQHGSRGYSIVSAHQNPSLSKVSIVFMPESATHLTRFLAWATRGGSPISMHLSVVILKVRDLCTSGQPFAAAPATLNHASEHLGS